MNNSQEIQIDDRLEKEDSFNLRGFVEKLLHKWYWFVISAILGLVAAFMYARFSTPLYRINAKILVNDDQKGSGLSGANDVLNLSSLLGTKSSVDNEAEVLRTRSLMEKVVKDLNSNITYFYSGVVRKSEIYTTPFVVIPLNIRDSVKTASFEVHPVGQGTIRLKNEDFDKVVHFDKPFEIKGLGRFEISRNVSIPFDKDGYSFEVSSVDSKVADYMQNFQAAVTNKLVSTIDLSLTYTLPKKGEDILNALIREYVEGNLNDKNLIADSTIAFIENRLIYVGKELGDIEGNIQRFKQNNKLADLSEQSKLLIENSSASMDELTKVETQLSILSSLREYLMDESQNKRVLPSAILPGDVVFSGLIDRYNGLLLERDRQSLSSTDNNPFLQNLDKQISNLRKDMLSNLENTRKTLIITRNDLRRRTGQVEGQIRRVPATERTYLDLARQQQIKQELYIFLLQKREETAISKTSNISNSKVIDSPKAEPYPFSPNRKMILFVGLLLGLCVPFGVIYFREIFNSKVLTKEDITSNSSIPIVGEISNNTSKDTIIVTKEARSPIAEQFRALRTNLQFFLRNEEKTILLTSSMSGEGKSFVSLNLATVLAISGKRVVVMEMDLRKPNLSNKMDVANTFGFTNYLISDDLRPEQILQSSNKNENLFLISSGPIPPNPAEMLLNKRVDQLFAYLKEHFDYVVIDAPPIGMVTDAQLLSKYADLTLYLVRQGYTFKNQLNIAQDLYRSRKMKQMALLVNDIGISGGYGYSYGYGYGYGYGDYGTESGSSKGWLRRMFSKK